MMHTTSNLKDDTGRAHCPMRLGSRTAARAQRCGVHGDSSITDPPQNSGVGVVVVVVVVDVVVVVVAVASATATRQWVVPTCSSSSASADTDARARVSWVQNSPTLLVLAVAVVVGQ
jgi:hypothetical protein